MPIYYGSNEITKIFDGSTEIGEVYYGGNLVFSSYQETFLGNVNINPTGDYALNYYCNAKAYKIRDHGRYYLKITGYWTSNGGHTSAHTINFKTNINVGAQNISAETDVSNCGTTNRQIPITCQCYYNRSTPDHSYVYNTYTGFVQKDGSVYLPLAEEGAYRTFDQYDYRSVLIPLTA